MQQPGKNDSTLSTSSTMKSSSTFPISRPSLLLEQTDSDDAISIWKDYARIFYNKWGLEPDVADRLGHMGGILFSIEHASWGDEAYERSIILPIRNAWYMAARIESRWAQLSEHSLKEPVLDWGCGVGFTLGWMKEEGFEDLYGYEVQGFQKTIMREYCRPRKISQDILNRYGTILCFNVLEHLHDPMSALDYLRSRTKNVIANCAMRDEGRHEHTANIKQRERVLESLKQNGEHL